jgi:hypothetical protein
MRVGANIKITPTLEFCIRNHQQIVDTVLHTDTVIRTYSSTYLPQQVVAIQPFPQNSATIYLDNATFAITIKLVCIVVIAIQAALLLRIANNTLGSYVMRYYFLIVSLPLLSQAVLSPASNPNESDFVLPGACSKQGEGTCSRSADTGV